MMGVDDLWYSMFMFVWPKAGGSSLVRVLLFDAPNAKTNIEINGVGENF